MAEIIRNRRGLTTAIKEKARELGYVSCGVTDASPFPGFIEGLDERIRRYPESAPLYEELREMAFPKKQAPWAESVIVCISRYGKYRLPEAPQHYFGKTYLVDGRLPYAPEYHSTSAFTTFLKELGMSVIVPRITARWSAARAGLGQFGKNNFIHTAHGSWVSVKLWLVDEALEYDAPQTGSPCPDRCTRCIDACPTRALEGPFAMNFGRCVTHLSFHLNDLPPEPIRKLMGTWIYGCDVCQNVCPLNRGKWEPAEEFPQLDEVAPALAPDRLAGMTQSTYEEIIQPRFWYIKKEDLWMWKSNALRAMANSGEERYHSLIKEARDNADRRVREMARWAEQSIGSL